MLRATIVYVWIALFALLLSPLGLGWALLSGDARPLFTLGRFCIRVSGLLAGIRVRARGLERIDAARTYVFLSNHQGNCDAPVLFHVIPRDLRAVVKKELMGVPVLARILRQARFVPINRRDPIDARRALEESVRLLEEGYSMFAFPEGTRSRDGQLGAFKKGVFALAVRAGAPVVPVTIRHSREVLPPGAYAMRPGVIEVVVHDPIPVDGLDRQRLADLTRAAIASALDAPEPTAAS